MEITAARFGRTVIRLTPSAPDARETGFVLVPKTPLLGMTAFTLARLSLDFEFVKEHGPPRLAREERFAPAPAGEAIP
jgi:hypothetical protein